MSIKNNFKHTKIASYFGYITQATVNNFAPLLFIQFNKEFDVPLSMITLLITINFLIQITVDIISAKLVTVIGYRPCAVAAHFLAAIGLAGLGIFPSLFGNPYIGILVAVFFYAVGGGLTEVVISPIIEACPTENKSAEMSLLHSFYCWGHAAVVLLSTLFFVIVGIENWRILAIIWAILPFMNAFYFMFVPIRTLEDNGRSMSIKELFKNKIFWIFIFLMFCSGASELSISQWSSAFAEAGLNVNKTVGDLAGPCAFAILMAFSRTFFAKMSNKIDLRKYLLFSAILAIVGYTMAAIYPLPVISLSGCAICGIAVGIMWPGTFSLASESLTSGGTSMFALLALAGDLGCTTGPTVVGFVSDAFGGVLSYGLIAALIFPICLTTGIVLFTKKKNK